jgi:hypothetical protein
LRNAPGERFHLERAEPRGCSLRSPRVFWRWFRIKELSKGWEPTDTGWVLTIGVIVLVESLALPEQCYSDGCRSKLDDFLRLKPSEMGDTLAGLFSALAFIWIIVTVFMQSRELREQRKEFREQRLATQHMARAMAAQAKIFEAEQRQRVEEYASSECEAIVEQLHRRTLHIFSTQLQLQIKDGDPVNFRVLEHISKRYSTGGQLSKQSTSRLLGHLVEAIKNIVPNLEDQLVTLESSQIDELRIFLRDLNSRLDEATPATRRRLNSETFKVHEFELCEYFGDIK